MNQDITKYFTKYTSVCELKSDTLPPCELDIQNALNKIQEQESIYTRDDLTDYEKGLINFFGTGELRDDDNGLYLLKKEANTENYNAKNIYGYACYHVSRNTNNDLHKKMYYEKQAIRYFQEAIEGKQPEAMLNLGICYLEGKLTEQNIEKGVKLIEMSIKNGNPKAILYKREYDKKRKIIPREKETETIFSEITDRIIQELKTLPNGQKTTLIGIYNDIYMAKDYQWIKNELENDWMSTNNNGKSFLILNKEFSQIYKLIQDNVATHQLELKLEDSANFNKPFYVYKKTNKIIK